MNTRSCLLTLAFASSACALHATTRKGWDTIYTTFDDAVPLELLERAAGEVSLIKDFATARMHKNDKATTFYRPFGGGKPRFAIEALVDFIGHALYKRWPKGDFAPGPFRRPKSSISGLEWWVQSRAPGEPIGYHYDKDEALANQNTMVPPAVSSVFYVNGCRSSPTQILNQTTLSGNDDAPRSPVQGLLSYPARNKYILFDGRLMHGVPPALRDPACTEHRATILINFWPDDGPPQPPNCIQISTAEIEAEMPALLDKKGARALLKRAKASLKADTAAARTGINPDVASAAVSPPENKRFRVLRLRDSSADALVGVGGAWTGPDVEHSIAFPPATPFRFRLPPAVHALGDTVRTAWASDKAASGVHGITDSAGGFVGFLKQHVAEVKVVVVTPAGKWPSFEKRVLEATRNYVEKARFGYIDLATGANMALNEFGVTEGPTVAVLHTHTASGSVRPGGDKVIHMDRWRRKLLKKAKREAKRNDGKIPLRVRRLADASPTPKRFARQIIAFLEDTLPDSYSAPHGPLVGGEPLLPEGEDVADAPAPAHDEL